MFCKNAPINAAQQFQCHFQFQFLLAKRLSSVVSTEACSDECTERPNRWGSTANKTKDIFYNTQTIWFRILLQQENDYSSISVGFTDLQQRFRYRSRYQISYSKLVCISTNNISTTQASSTMRQPDIVRWFTFYSAFGPLYASTYAAACRYGLWTVYSNVGLCVSTTWWDDKPNRRITINSGALCRNKLSVDVGDKQTDGRTDWRTSLSFKWHSQFAGVLSNYSHEPCYWSKQVSPAIADKPARRESMPKIAPIRRAYNVVADNTGLSSYV